MCNEIITVSILEKAISDQESMKRNLIKKEGIFTMSDSNNVPTTNLINTKNDQRWYAQTKVCNWTDFNH